MSPTRPTSTPTRHWPSFRSGLAATFIACLLLPALASPAAATPQTILRGLSNIALAPLDIGLAPVSSFIGIYKNLQDIDDSTLVRVTFTVPAYFYAVNLQIGCAMIRAITGMLEVIPGVPLMFMDADMDPLFDAVEDASALAEIDIDYMDNPLRFGLDYSSPDF